MRTLLIAMTFAGVLCAADVKGSAEDEKAIRTALAEGTAAFNRHELLTKSAVDEHFDVIVPPGNYAKAGPEFAAMVKRDLGGIFKNAQEVATVERIRFLRPDVALVDGTFEITGSTIKPDPKGLQTLILVKEKGRWLVTAMRRMIPVAAPE